MKKCAYIMKCSALQNGDDVLENRAKNFVQLCEMEWPSAVSSHALRTLRRRQWNKPKRLPLAADVKKLNDHVSSKAEFNSNILRASPDDTHTWNELAKATLVTVMLFNRRRSGEIQRIPFQSYQNSSISVDSDIYECLSE